MKLGEAVFDKDDCLTIEEVAKELGVKTQRATQLIVVAINKRLITNLVIKDGLRKFYPEPMIGKLKEVYFNGSLLGRRPKVTENGKMTGAKVVISVPIFDDEMKNVLMLQFGDEMKIARFLTDKLYELYKPIQTRLSILDEEYRKKRESLLRADGIDERK